MKTATSGACFVALAMAISLAVGCSSAKPGMSSGSAGTSGIAGSSSAGTAGTAGMSGATAAGGAGGNAMMPGASGTAGAAGSETTAGAAGTGGASGAAGNGTTAGAAGNGTTAGAGGGPVTIAACAPPADALQPIAKLSQTGCMDGQDIKKMAAFVVPYEVNSPLWSDNADKSRGFVLAAGKKIHVKDCAATPAECPQGTQDTGKWVMPVGTVMVKSFGFDGKLVETRLLAHPDSDTWNGYSYQWNEAQTEATIVPPDDDPSLNGMRANVAFNTGTRTIKWEFPFRLDCNGCHTAEAGGTLGPETRQMNRVVGGTNQLDKWKVRNLFETPPKMPYQAALVLPYDGQLGTVPTGATREQRARSYLHANCAYCHRPDDPHVNWLDFRYDTSLKNMGACAVKPMKGEVGVAGALILKPGKPLESTMWLRMHSPATGDKTRMPWLATYVVDVNGLAVVGDWITSTTCPP